MYLVFLLSFSFFLGVVGVASNPSACFAAGALMVAVGSGCGILAEVGGFFLAMVLFLVYLGGMLVVLVFSVALFSDSYPVAWGGFVGWCALLYLLLVVGLELCYGSAIVGGVCWFMPGVVDYDSGYGGVCLLYSAAGWSLAIVGAGLLLTLFVVLELVRGVSFGALRG